jgi:PAS domain-containing protein
MGDVSTLRNVSEKWQSRGPRSGTKAAQDDVEDANERLRSVLASVSDCYFTLDGAYHITDLNEAGMDWVGPDPDRIFGACLWDLCAPDAECSRVIRDGMEGRRRIRREVKSSLRPGHWLDLLVCPSAEGLSVFFTDITERRAARRRWTNWPVAF